MTKWLIRLIALLLIVAAVLYWLRVSAVDDRLERLASDLAAFGQLSWGSVVIDPRGRVIVGDVAFRPDQEPDTIRIGTMTLGSNDWTSLQPASPDIQGQTTADRWTAELEEVRFPIGSQVSGWSLEWLGLMVPLRASACAGFKHPTLGDLIKLGYGRIQLDAKLTVQAMDDAFAFDLELDVRDLSKSRMRWELTQSSSVRSLEDLPAMVDTAALRSLDYEISDRGLLQRLDAACTAPTEVSVSGSIDPRFKSWLKTWNDLGLEPGSIVQAGFRHHLEQPESAVSISARPKDAIPLSDLRDSIDRDMIQALNLSFSIADGPGIAVTLQNVASTREPPAPTPVAVDTTSILRSENDTETTIVVGRPPDWTPILLNTLPDHIGARVRIDFLDGTQMTGQIAGLSEGQLELLTQSRMGEFVRPIPLDKILAIAVRP